MHSGLSSTFAYRLCVRIGAVLLLVGIVRPAPLAQPVVHDTLGVALAGPVAEAWLPEGRPSRAEALTRARRARLDALRPPEPGWVEAFLLEHEDMLAGGTGGPGRFYLVLGGAGEAAPLAGGVGVRAFPGRVDRLLNVQAAASTGGSVAGRVESGLALGPVALRGAGVAARYNEERFYGLGSDADADRERYELREGAADVLAAVRPLRPLRLAVTAGYRVYDLRAGGFAAGLPGVTDDRAYAVIGLRIGYDGRDGIADEGGWSGSRGAPGGEGNPQRGVYAAVAVERFEETGGAAFSFTRYEAEVRAHVSFRRGYQRLALRHRTVYADPDGGAVVPFYLQPHLGGSFTLRGFAPFRFRDRGTLLFNAEYRWRVWRLLDFVLFADAGRVFHRLGDWGLAELETAGGGGLRFATRADVLLRLDLARSREGLRLHASFVAPF